MIDDATTPSDQPVKPWWVYRATGKAAPDNRPTDLVIQHLNPTDAPKWRQFGSTQESKRGANYQATEQVIDRVNAALLLRRPLLVTGRPGTGKTALAHAIALELGLGKVLSWLITSSTTLPGGLYHYDAIGRLQDTPGLNDPAQSDPEDSTRRDRRPQIDKYLRLGPLGTAFAGKKEGDRYFPRVLLIDEIDKGDIDLPNDLLHIFEEGKFEIPELKRDKKSSHEIKPWDNGPHVVIDEGEVPCHAFPIVIMTSNDEREFPPAFRRRCLELKLEPPMKEDLKQIVYARLELEQDSEHEGQIERLVDDFLVRRTKGDLAADQLLNAVYLVMQQVDLLGEGKPIKDPEALLNAVYRYLNSSES